MAKYIFVGANSTIATTFIETFGGNHDLFCLTRDVNKLPDICREQHTCISVNPIELKALDTIIKDISDNNIIDGVVNFCGSILLKPASMISETDWQNTLDINLTTAFNVVKASVKNIKKDCSILLFSSAAATIGLPNHEAIAAAKAGVEGLARAASATYAHQNIRINVIAPGLTETNLGKSVIANEKARTLSLALHPLKRFGQPIDIARAIEWMLSPDNHWLTGETIHLDGGLARLKSYNT